MNVLSLFDGMSCGQIALAELNIQVETYYASEIDKHAIRQTQLNFPNTIQLGSVVDVDISKLKPIDMLIGGSPCQSFSFAGKRKGMSTKCEIEITTLDQYLTLKKQGFEFEGQSYLFWEYMRVLTDIRKYNPNVVFLLENVEMGKKWEFILSKAIGIDGVHINSALVSAQNRRRIYWSNIRTRITSLFGDMETAIPQPKDRGIVLKDILQDHVDKKYTISSDRINYFNRKIEKGFLQKIESDVSGKSECLLATMHKQMQGFCVAMRGREDAVLSPKRTEYGKSVRKQYETGEIIEKRKNIQQLEPRTDGKTNTITSVQKDNLVIQINPSLESGWKQPYQQNRVYDTNGISPASMAQMSSGTHAIKTQSMIRRLTPTECTRLQTIPDWYKWECSDTQQYRMLGNGWTVEVIKHIFSFLNQQDTTL